MDDDLFIGCMAITIIVVFLAAYAIVFVTLGNPIHP